MLIYTQDSYGLGHLRRVTTLSKALVARRKDLNILLVVDSPLAPFFELGERMDFIKLPTIVKVDAGVFRPHRLLMDYDHVNRLRSRTIREVMESFEPDLLLVDHMPGGANCELLPALKHIRDKDMQTKCFVGLRDIIDDPAVVQGLWKREKVYEAIEQYYDGILLYSTPEYYPTAEKYGIPSSVSHPHYYCGHICDAGSLSDRPVQRNVRPVVSAIAGGGADSYQLMWAFLDAVEKLKSGTVLDAVIVTGPFLKSDLSDAIQSRAESLEVAFYRSLPDTRAVIEASDVVVSMAGYNTVCEIMRSGKPAVIVPRSGPSKEQTIRASILEERGIASCIALSSLTGSGLAGAIETSLNSPGGKGWIPDLDGACKAADLLVSSLPLQ